MWLAAEERLQGPLTSIWGPRGNTDVSNTSSGRKVPAQLPKVGGRPERGRYGRKVSFYVQQRLGGTCKAIQARI